MKTEPKYFGSIPQKTFRTMFLYKDHNKIGRLDSAWYQDEDGIPGQDYLYGVAACVTMANGQTYCSDPVEMVDTFPLTSTPGSIEALTNVSTNHISS